jgi:hypothetical protein
MSSDPDDPLEEIYRIKDDLAREAGYDTKKFFEQLNEWVKENPIPPDRLITTQELLRRKGSPGLKPSSASV